MLVEPFVEAMGCSRGTMKGETATESCGRMYVCRLIIRLVSKPEESVIIRKDGQPEPDGRTLEPSGASCAMPRSLIVALSSRAYSKSTLFWDYGVTHKLDRATHVINQSVNPPSLPPAVCVTSPGDGGDAIGRDLVQGHVDAKSQLGEQRDLGLHVVALHVRRGVGCPRGSICVWGGGG